MKQFNEYVSVGPSAGNVQPVADLGDIPPFNQALFAQKGKPITKSDLDQVERYADKLFAALGIDVEFTKHFMDRVNDARNMTQITPAELVRLFKQSYKKYGKKIAKMTDDANAVIHDMKTDINMPFVLNHKKGEIELVAKTVMRKKNFTTSGSSPKLSFEEFSEASRIPRKKGQPAGSDKHSDLYTDENPRGTIHGLGFKDVETAQASVKKIESSGKKHAHKVQAAIAMEQRAREMGKKAEAAIYRTYIEKMKKVTKQKNELSFESFQHKLDEVATGDFAPVTHQMSLSELIFDSAGHGSDMSATSTIRGGAGSVANNMWLPLSGSIFKRALPKEVRATVYHVTRMSNFDQLYAIQNSKRSISTFANMDRGPIAGGVQGGSGLVVEVDGNVLAASREDLFTIPEKSGRRMMAFNWFRGPWGSNDVVKMAKGLEKLLKSLVNKYGKSFDGKAPKGKGDWEKWEHMRGVYVTQKRWGDKSAGRVMQSIVKDYMDGVEKVFKQNAKQVQDTLTNYVKRRKTDDNWDEIVVDDFNIKKVWIITDSDELNPGDAEAFKETISLTKIPVETIDSQDMEALVRYEAQLATGS